MSPRADPNNDSKLLAAILKCLEARCVDWEAVGNHLDGINPDARQRWERLRRGEDKLLRGVVINGKPRHGRQPRQQNVDHGNKPKVEEPEDLGFDEFGDQYRKFL